MAKKKAKSSGSIRVRPSVKETVALKAQVADLQAERDGLAARVLELEKPTAVPTESPTAQFQQRVEALEEFIRRSMSTATFNSTEAGKLLDPPVEAVAPPAPYVVPPLELPVSAEQTPG